MSLSAQAAVIQALFKLPHRRIKYWKRRSQLSSAEGAFRTRNFFSAVSHQCLDSSLSLPWPCSGILRLRPQLLEGLLWLSGLPIFLSILGKTRKRSPWVCHSFLCCGLNALNQFILSNAMKSWNFGEVIMCWGWITVLIKKTSASLWHRERIHWERACYEAEDGSYPETESAGALIF